MKFSTLVIIVEEITPNSITYTSKTDIQPRDYKHIIPSTSMFPFKGLHVGHSYSLICVQLERTWFWYVAHDLTDSSVLKDTSLRVSL